MNKVFKTFKKMKNFQLILNICHQQIQIYHVNTKRSKLIMVLANKTKVI